MNSPFATNLDKTVAFKDRKEQREQKEAMQNAIQNVGGTGVNPLVNLQLYQPNMPPPKQQTVNPSLYIPITGPSIYTPPQYQCDSMYVPNENIPVIKKYNIYASGPNVNHNIMATVYEDALPDLKNLNTNNTIGERIEILNYIRSVLIKKNDGEDISLDNNARNSLMNYLKFLELNPYNTSLISDNPYASLPDNMLIYKTCYPIRYDGRTSSVQCSPDSMGINVRIYKLTDDEYNVRNLPNGNYNDYDVWREISYYSFIREMIIKKKVSPNFITMYLYYICEKCNIDFESIKKIRDDVLNKRTPLPMFRSAVTPGQQYTAMQSVKAVISNKAIVALTEAPTYNFMSWTTKTYRQEGHINKMINTGYHNGDVWYSILFQIFIALHVMQKNQFVFDNFNIFENIFIKELSQHSNIVKYWKYNVSGIEYYIPNYGFMALIDSNFSKKIIWSGFGAQDSERNRVNDVIKNIVNTLTDSSTFSNAFANRGGTAPPAEIKTMLSNMHNQLQSEPGSINVAYYILRYFGKFLNNRIGTLLSETEIKSIRKEDSSPFRLGEIVVYQEQYETYRFGMFMEVYGNSTNVMTKNASGEITTFSLNSTLCYHYSKYEPITQIYKPNETLLTEDELLETYTI